MAFSLRTPWTRTPRQELVVAPSVQARSVVLADRHRATSAPKFTQAPAIQNSSMVTGLSFADFQRLFVLDTHSGANVNAENAGRAIPVQAVTTLISGGITSMPLRIVQRVIVNGQATLQPADDHPYWWLFNEQPNDDTTSSHFLEQIVKRKLLWGRSFARIIRKSGGRSIEIDQLIWYPNECVQIEKNWDEIAKIWRITRYLFRDGLNSYGVPPEDVLDFRGAQAPHDWAMSEELWSAREAVGLCMTIEEYCGKFFANGGMPRTTIEFPNKADKDQQELLREAWVRKYGGAENAGMPLILTQGGKASKLSWNAEEAQMLEARKFQVIEIARAWGVPPFMIGETEKSTAWGTGLESLGLGFIRYTLGRHITAIEQEINRKIFRISKYFVDFDEEALARGDMASLGTWFRQAVGGSNGPGFMTRDEVRARLKMSPLPDGAGDTAYTPPAGATNAAQSPDGTNSGEQKPPP
jgi:HK97 family phage portal protein